MEPPPAGRSRSLVRFPGPGWPAPVKTHPGPPLGRPMPGRSPPTAPTDRAGLSGHCHFYEARPADHRPARPSLFIHTSHRRSVIICVEIRKNDLPRTRSTNGEAQETQDRRRHPDHQDRCRLLPGEHAPARPQRSRAGSTAQRGRRVCRARGLRDLQRAHRDRIRQGR